MLWMMGSGIHIMNIIFTVYQIMGPIKGVFAVNQGEFLSHYFDTSSSQVAVVNSLDCFASFQGVCWICEGSRCRFDIAKASLYCLPAWCPPFHFAQVIFLCPSNFAPAHIAIFFFLLFPGSAPWVCCQPLHLTGLLWCLSRVQLILPPVAWSNWSWDFGEVWIFTEPSASRGKVPLAFLARTIHEIQYWEMHCQ